MLPQRPNTSSSGKPLLIAQPHLPPGPSSDCGPSGGISCPTVYIPTPHLAHSRAERQHWSLVGKGRAQEGWEFKKDQPPPSALWTHLDQRKMLRAEERGHLRRNACPGVSVSWVKASCPPGKKHHGVNLRGGCGRSVRVGLGAQGGMGERHAGVGGAVGAGWLSEATPRASTKVSASSSQGVPSEGNRDQAPLLDGVRAKMKIALLNETQHISLKHQPQLRFAPAVKPLCG